MTTDPSARIAAKARPVPWTCCTFLSWSCTAELSPPPSALPQVTILLPPKHHDAKAPLDSIFFVAATFPLIATAVRQYFSSSRASKSDWAGSNKMRPSAVTSLSNPCWNLFWAKIVKSPTLEDRGSEMISLQPLAKTTAAWNIEKKHGAFLDTTRPGKKGIWSPVRKPLEPKWCLVTTRVFGWLIPRAFDGLTSLD